MTKEEQEVLFNALNYYTLKKLDVAAELAGHTPMETKKVNSAKEVVEECIEIRKKISKYFEEHEK